MEPSSYSRRILLVVTGLSPQVVTETVYALAVNPEKGGHPFIPTEIHLITTETGARKARDSLLAEKDGWFHRLCADYSLGSIDFAMHSICDPDGNHLDDIRTASDNERAADFMTEQVRQLTEDDNSALHVSIAGGRKTMGYYLGYALSLYGRAQDRLSHVLVSEPFEGNPNFYYPTPYEHVIRVRQGAKEVDRDAREAKVELAEIPFVRLRDGLPDELLEGRARFSDAVAEAQRALPPLSLTLDPATRTVTAAGETFTLLPSEFAFYWMLAERARSGRPGLHWSDVEIVDELLSYFGRLVNPNSGDYEKTEKAYRRGYEKENFDPTKTHVNNALKASLGKRRAQAYLIKKLELKKLKKYPKLKYWRNGLALPASVIQIKDTSRPGQKKNERKIAPGDSC